VVKFITNYNWKRTKFLLNYDTLKRKYKQANESEEKLLYSICYCNNLIDVRCGYQFSVISYQLFRRQIFSNRALDMALKKDMILET